MPMSTKSVWKVIGDWFVPRVIPQSLEFESEGFSLKYRGGRADYIRWDDIHEIKAGRQPAATIDIAYLALVLSDGARTIAIDEMVPGFEGLLSRLSEHWPEIGRRWTAVYTGSPERAECTTIWLREREKSY